MTDLKADIELGGHAEALLSNPAHQAAMARIKANIFDQWTGTGLFQSKERKDLWQMARVVEQYEKELRLMLEDALIASQDLKRSLKSIK